MSENKTIKPLVVHLRHGLAEGKEHTWNRLQNPQDFIENIVTPEINPETDMNKIVSGIPSPFARINMIKYAIEYIYDDSNIDIDAEGALGLMAFYKALQDEWKGLISCIALDSAPISVEKIELVYSDKKGLDKTKNIFEVKGALGNMLFEDKDLWCDQGELDDKTKDPIPFIYLIRYKGELIGGTSPETIVFTAPNYSIESRFPFINKKNGKFIDPLKGRLDQDSVQTLYIYVSYIVSKLNEYESYFNKRKKQIDTGKLSAFLKSWIKDIEQYAKRKKYEITKDALVTNINIFKPPFDILFNKETKLYGAGGIISTKPIGDKAREIDPANLLLPHDSTTLVQFEFEHDYNSDISPVHLLEIDYPTEENPRGKKYFTLPLTQDGLFVFQDNLEGLLGKSTEGNIRSNLKADYNEHNNQLYVTLKLDIDGNETIIDRTYSKPVIITNKKMIVWPDFISKIWDKYYCYSELPHNSKEEVKVYPLQADKEEFKLIYKDGKLPYIVSEDHKPEPQDPSKLLIEYDFDKLGVGGLQYEIYESDKPFKGFEIRISKGNMDNTLAGYIIVKNINQRKDYFLKDYRNEKNSLSPVNVGIDFGSNNMCISYASRQDSEPKLIKFKNRRRFIIGKETFDPYNKKPAMPHEVFFFQNEETKGNEVKSLVMIHDEKRIQGENAIKNHVSGGFPCFKKNVPVVDSGETMHTVDFGHTTAHLKYNMKWSLDNKENSYKEGLLKTLWLNIYAELLDEEKYPENVIWAFPSSMGRSIVLKYATLWKNMTKLNPGGDKINEAKVAENTTKRDLGILRALTESEAVANYALSPVAKMTVRDDTIAMGFDVGGSTTDILCIAKDKNYKTILIKQSSIKIAAGKLAEATAKSSQVQKAIQNYCKQNNIFIFGIDSELNNNTAPYFFNAVVDQLGSISKDELDRFYSNVYSDGCSDIFVINTYLTGLILFYAGQLAAKIKDFEDYSQIENFEIGFFGKGGRMFGWLPALSKHAAENYYETCFKTGYKKEDNIRMELFSSDESHIKAEVSFGLSLENKIHGEGEKIAEIFGEEGYMYNNQLLGPLSDVKVEHLLNFNGKLRIPNEYTRFKEFLSVFGRFVREQFDFNINPLIQDLRGMRLIPYIEGIPEFKEAKKNSANNPDDFDFEAPLIILEGMAFLENVLMKNVFK